MKRLLFTILCLIFWDISYSQQIGISVGLTSNLCMPIDFYYASHNGFGFKLNFSPDLNPGKKGQKYSVIGWDQFPDDLLKEDSYYTTCDLGIGKYFHSFFVLALAGLASETVYRNCFDDSHILSHSGYYYKQIKGGSHLDFGVELGYIKRNVLLGLHVTRYSGIGFKIGYRHQFKNAC